MEDLQAELDVVLPLVQQLLTRTNDLWGKVRQALGRGDELQLDDHYHCFLSRLSPVSEADQYHMGAVGSAAVLR
jgi:hypothetical protein